MYVLLVGHIVLLLSTKEDEKKAQEEDRTFLIRDDTVSGVSKNISFPLDRKQPIKTAQDDIHLGLVHEWYDDIMNEDEFAIANEYLENIHGLYWVYLMMTGNKKYSNHP